MAKDKNYWAGPSSSGDGWQVKREGAERASAKFQTQEEAWDYARAHAKDTGGEAFLQNREGQIRERNTYGKDPYPPKG